MDLSHQAVKSQVFPISVGLRSQSLKLKFLSQESAGHFLNPAFPLSKAMEIFDGRFTASMPKPILHHSHIGESLSVIYSPFYVDKKLYDGVLDKPISDNLPDSFDIKEFPSVPQKSTIRFVPTLCPNCGWDLEGQRDSIVLICRNCDSMWRGSKKGFKHIRFAHVPETNDQIRYLPFWRIKANVSGVDLVSYADLARLANLPKAVQKGWEDIEFRFWALAFKVRPQSFLRLANHLTLTQPQDKLETTLPDGTIHPVTLPVTEAVETLKMNLASFMKPKKLVFETLQEIKIKALSFILVYIPFFEKHHDLVQPKYMIAVNKNQLRLSGNL